MGRMREVDDNSDEEFIIEFEPTEESRHNYELLKDTHVILAQCLWRTNQPL